VSTWKRVVVASGVSAVFAAVFAVVWGCAVVGTAPGHKRRAGVKESARPAVARQKGGNRMRNLNGETAALPRRGLVAALAAGAGAGLATAWAAPPAGADTPTMHPLVGAWEIGVTHPPGEPAPPGLTVNPGMLLFTADGGVVWSGIAPVTGAGRWRRLPSVGPGGFEYVFRAPATRADATQPLGFRYVGMLHVHQTGTVTADTYTATGRGDQYAPDGTTVLTTSRSTTNAVRITVGTG
jgi:hypothetical protein